MTVDVRGRVAVMTEYSGVLTARRDGGLVREVSHEESACKWCEVPHQTRSTHRSTRARQTPQDGDRLQGRLSVSPPSTGGQYEVVRRCRALPRHLLAGKPVINGTVCDRGRCRRVSGQSGGGEGRE